MSYLIIGGSKSGKSLYAQNLAKKLEEKDGKLYYIATMTPFDEEDRKRIENHIKEREGYGFITIEKSTNIGDLKDTVKSNDVVLIDCITSLLCSEMFSKESKDLKEKDWAKYISKGVIEILEICSNTIVVSDYIFSEAKRFDEFTDEFRKELASINIELAKVCNKVIECNFSNITYHK
ncbi:bifunctional adenosylcobinamide kinase/adenosylcobinamide-phosphate guanylyltransferase [Clostridium fallax]|uniref:Adenosylcobinamide kinase n=1 Tax=Clostridium fallax TaxID=1533 RepID=A0A1M4Y375_9CLOT|nr:bifunctional adenosylcobinamide kinase/adenosylcobinamide-phosphate guanylyltransferase [Clostridium fallax]SHF00139.1 adenosylcobinamide kinase /adenosylcobinamide-phosphate guanylyltransferase [Clostridium fallax]SQB07796.1 adenosylcobinamide-phosphate guanylyltransferase CobU [Clostridium fallax]